MNDETERVRWTRGNEQLGGVAHWHRLGKEFAEIAMAEWPMIDWDMARRSADAFTISAALKAEEQSHER